MTEIVVYDAARNYSAAPLESRKEYVATIAAASALLPRAAQNPNYDVQLAQTFYICEVGAMMGIHPLEALAGIHMIDGRWTISSALMSSLVRQAGHKLRVTEDGSWRDGTYVATCTIVRHDDHEYPTVMTFGYEDAEMAGLLGKGNWQKYGKSMCVARAISKCARAAAEDALGGARYTPEELGATVDAEGEPVDGGHYESMPSTPPAPAAAPQPAPPAPPAAEHAAPEPAAESHPTVRPAAKPAAAPAPTPAPDRGTASAAARPAAEVTDEQIISAVSDAAIVHARNAWGAAGKGDVETLRTVWDSAEAAKVLTAPALAFDDLGRPSVWQRDEAGAPIPLGSLIRVLRSEVVQQLADAEAAAQDAAAEQLEQPVYAEDSGEPVDAEEEPQDGGDDSAA
ncbi:hypothetical protein [Pseudomonas sp.]|uniref:hypothetical protein n=1 Tax=Pseudomonas sp. TaxID=306 RepID=UPI0026257046|nr:hypothetical protein [Pseudomonas sp.]